jgi:hypothetical protein
MTADPMTPAQLNSPAEQHYTDSVLQLFAVRANELAGRVGHGLTFIDAVDMAYSAAIWSGLVDAVGDDAVQDVLADAFRGKKK